MTSHLLNSELIIVVHADVQIVCSFLYTLDIHVGVNQWLQVLVDILE